MYEYYMDPCWLSVLALSASFYVIASLSLPPTPLHSPLPFPFPPSPHVTLSSSPPHTLTPAASKRSHQGGGVSSKDVKARYEKQLSELKVELKSLKLAKKEHSKAMKKNVSRRNRISL